MPETFTLTCIRPRARAFLQPQHPVRARPDRHRHFLPAHLHLRLSSVRAIGIGRTTGSSEGAAFAAKEKSLSGDGLWLRHRLLLPHLSLAAVFVSARGGAMIGSGTSTSISFSLAALLRCWPSAAGAAIGTCTRPAGRAPLPIHAAPVKQHPQRFRGRLRLERVFVGVHALGELHTEALDAHADQFFRASFAARHCSPASSRS